MTSLMTTQATKEERLKDIPVKEIKTERIANLYLSQGVSFSLVIEADKEQQQNIKIYRDGDHILIYTHEQTEEMKTCNVYITIPYTTEEIAVNAFQTGTVSTGADLIINSLQLNFNVVGTTNLGIISDKLVYTGNSVSNSTIKGKAEKLNLSLKSATDFNAEKLSVQYLNLKTDSLVNADFNVENTLSMRSNNSFNVNITGNPVKIKKQLDALSTVTFK